MKIWVTGARGFIGRHVASLLAAGGVNQVHGLGHGAWPEFDRTRAGLVEWRNGEVGHANLDALAASHGLPDGIVHLAGGSAVGPSFAQPAEDFRRSVLAAGELAEWLRLRAPQARLVMASSAAVYGAGHSGAIAETADCRPFSPYGCHKRIVELLLASYAQNFGLPIAIVRFFSVYGPGLRKQLLWDACSRLTAAPERLALGGHGDELRDWLHVRDAASLLAAALQVASAECPMFNGGTGVATTIREVAEQLGRAWQPDAPPRISFSGESRRGDPASLVADTAAAGAIGWHPAHGWRDGITEYAAWFKAQAHGVSA